MQELWSSASYEPHLLSLPFALAPAAMSIVIAYAIVMRGARAPRAWLLLHFISLMPYSVTMMLSPSIRSPAAAEAWFRFAGAFIPMAAAGGAGFHMELLQRARKMRLLVWAGLVHALVWMVICSGTDLIVRDVRWLPAGFWFADLSPVAILALATTIAISLPGFTMVALAALRGESSPSDERRQLRLVLVANLVTYAGLGDVALGYGVGVFPFGWLLSGVGSLLVVRALIVDDLLRVRAVDTTAPNLVLHCAAAIVLGWAALGLAGPGLTWWGATHALLVSFAGVRIALALIGLISRGGRGREGPLERLLGQLVSRARSLRSEPEVAQLAIDIVELALGKRVRVQVAAAEDWGWTTATGQRVPDADAPDPLLVGWLAERRTTLFAGDYDAAPEDLRPLLIQLFERENARAIVPVGSHDELIAIVIIPASSRRLRGRELEFVERAGERLGEAIVHVRMTQRAAARAALAREVELAAAVQEQLLPTRGAHVLGDITVFGSWLPATRCAGDFWGIYPLTEGRVLVAIGDVTGHGVASATVTAAVAAACDVVVRKHGAAFDLEVAIAALDSAVRRVGRGELHMTCFVSILDPRAQTISYVSCGQTTPYVCRAGASDLELHALVGRGNPLGGSGAVHPKIQQRPLRPGDVVVWYTDGVIDAADPGGQPFGDRRLQRLLRKLDRTHLAPTAVHSAIHTGVAAHRAGRPRNDDETLVVAQWMPQGEKAP